MTPPPNNNRERHLAYWRANKRLIGILLAIWAFVSFGCGILFVVPLNKFTLGNLPFGFWMAQQGAIYVFVVLIFVYAWRMDRLDHQYKLDKDEAPDPGSDI